MQQAILILGLILVALIAYRWWKPALSPPVKETLPGTATLYMFYTTWCGYSKKALPEWDKLPSTATYGTTTVTFTKVDCEAKKDMCTQYEIKSYPNVKLETSGGLREYTGSVTHDGLIAFLTESLGAPASA